MRTGRTVIFISILLVSAINLFFLFSQSIRLDEAQSIWVSTKSLSTLLIATGQDVQVPLYPVILHFWLQIFGTDISVVRLLSVIFFILTLPVLYRLIRESSDEKVALLGVLLFSLSPFVLWYSFEARTYTLLTLAVTMSHLFFLRMWRTNGRTGKSGFLLAGLIGIFSHYFFFFLLLTQLIFAAAIFLTNIKRGQKILDVSFHKFFFSFLGLFFLLLLLFLPWAAYVFSLGLAANTQPLIPKPTSFNLLQVFINFIFGFQSPRFQSLLISFWPLILIILFFVFMTRQMISLRDTRYFITATFLPVIIVFAVSFIRPVFLSRYLILATPTLFALIAWVLTNFGNKIYWALTLGVLIIMFSLEYLQNRSIATPVREDYQQVTDYTERNATPQDIIAVSAPFTIYPIEYSYTGLARIDTIPEWNHYSQGPIPKFSPIGFEEQINGYKKVYYRLFLILSYDQGYQGTVQSYLDKHYELLQKIQYSADIQLRVYKLRYDPPLAL